MTKKEREFIRLLLQQDGKIKRLYSETVNNLAGNLNQFKLPANGIYDADTVWTRNKAIEAKIDRQLKAFHDKFVQTLTESRAGALGISKKYGDELINNYLATIPISEVAKAGIFSRSMEAFEAFQKKGLDVSPRVWKTAKLMKDQIALYASSGLASGRSSAKIASGLKDFLQHPDKRFRRVRDQKTGKLKLSQPAKNFHPGRGVYRSSYQNALRLAQSETNMAFRYADQARWKQMPFITGYEVRLSPQHPFPDICDSMHGKYPKTFSFGGWHPKCICFTVPIMAKKDEFISYLKGGKLNSKMVKTIPRQATNYVNAQTPAFKRWTNKPYFLRDNFTLQNGEYKLRKAVQKVDVISPEKLTQS